jgi:hypothetical protein
MAAAGGYGKTADTSFATVKIDNSKQQTPRSSSCTANIKVRRLAGSRGPSLPSALQCAAYLRYHLVDAEASSLHLVLGNS